MSTIEMPVSKKKPPVAIKDDAMNFQKDFKGQSFAGIMEWSISLRIVMN